ncbi:hypothetical protein DL765_004665 [Monosporascus sp. GIB2]|nr:hypothetical protein DL765_004665 [Monosporascus sp. GIB2]
MANYPFEVRVSPGKGMGCFATRDIAVGSIILVEQPLLVVRDRSPIRDLIQAFDALNEDQQREFLALHSHVDKARAPRVQRRLQALRNAGILTRDDDMAKYFKVDSIFRANCFDMYDAPRHTDEPGNNAVYLEASRFNHSCDPNVTYGLTWSPGNWASRAKRNIKAGEELTINYTSIAHPLKRRREELLYGWGFECQCSACVEDTAVRAWFAAENLPESLLNLDINIESAGSDDNDVVDHEFTRRAGHIKRVEESGNLAELHFVYADAAEWKHCRAKEYQWQQNYAKAVQNNKEAVKLQELAVPAGLAIWGDTDPLIPEANKWLRTFENYSERLLEMSRAAAASDNLA